MKISIGINYYRNTKRHETMLNVYSTHTQIKNIHQCDNLFVFLYKLLLKLCNLYVYAYKDYIFVIVLLLYNNNNYIIYVPYLCYITYLYRFLLF